MINNLKLKEINLENNLLHKEFIYIIDKGITASYADLKKLVRENNAQKNIINNRNIYASLIKLKQATEALMGMYQERING